MQKAYTPSAPSNLRAFFPEALKFYRKHAKYTQEELGMASGISSTHISHFEAGRRLPSLDNFKDLVIALNVPPQELLGL